MPQGLSTASSPVIQTGRTYADRPMVRRISNEEIEKRKQAEETAKFEQSQNRPVISSLASHVRAAFTSAVSAKSTVMQRMLQCLRQREMIYEADIAALIKQSNGTAIYMGITDIKCRALESWLKDLMLPSGEKPYSIEPTPVPDIPPQFAEKARQAFVQDYVAKIEAQAGYFHPSMINEDDMREAAERFKDDLLQAIRDQARTDADAIEDQVDDELVEGHWYNELSELIEDFATYPTAFLEGPTYRRRQVLEWKPVQGTLLAEVSVTEKVVKEYDRIDGFDVYPSPGAKTLQDGDLCIRKRFTRRDLDALRGVDGFDGNAINQVLERYSRGYREFISYDTEIADLHDRPNETQDPEGHIDGIKFYGSVQGLMLRQWGMTMEQIPDPFREYPVIAYVIGTYVIGARLNAHPLGRRNIYSASFRNKNGSIWGKALPELMRGEQNMCNSCARSIANNAAMASGPQVWQYVDLIPPECDRTDMFPWKIWEFSSEKVKAAGMRPMDFFQPTLIVDQLLNIYEYFAKQASETTGVPAYIYGNEGVGGAGKTASGLSMLMNAAAKGLRNAAGNLDKGIIAPSVQEHWLTIMLTRPDLARGDCKIVARASEYLIQQEQLQMRRSEVLERTNNPVDLEIMGMDGRSELLRENFKSLKMNVEKLIPRREDMIAAKVQQELQQIIMTLAQALGVPPEQLMAILQQPPGPGQGGGQGQSKKPRELDAAGSNMAGMDVRQFNQ